MAHSSQMRAEDDDDDMASFLDALPAAAIGQAALSDTFEALEVRRHLSPINSSSRVQTNPNQCIEPDSASL